MQQKQFKEHLEQLASKFLRHATHSPDETFIMPEGKVKETADFVIRECRNCPQQAVLLLLMALADCYGKIARMTADEGAIGLKQLIEEDSPLNNLAYRFVENFEKLRSK